MAITEAVHHDQAGGKQLPAKPLTLPIHLCLLLIQHACYKMQHSASDATSGNATWHACVLRGTSTEYSRLASDGTPTQVQKHHFSDARRPLSSRFEGGLKFAKEMWSHRPSSAPSAFRIATTCSMRFSAKLSQHRPRKQNCGETAEAWRTVAPGRTPRPGTTVVLKLMPSGSSAAATSWSSAATAKLGQS